VRELERDVALRKQELGAVELRRAAVERREETAAERETALEQVASDLRDRELLLAERARSVPSGSNAPALDPEPEAGTHLLYVARDGWRLVERDGPVPPLDAYVEVDGEPLVVTRVGRSPLPGDRRACVYLEPARNPSQHQG
jgi:hypothetical protein